MAAAARNVTEELVLVLREQTNIQFDIVSSPDDRVVAAGEFRFACVRVSRNLRAASMVRAPTDEISRLHYLMPFIESHVTSETERASYQAIFEAVVSGSTIEAEASGAFTPR